MSPADDNLTVLERLRNLERDLHNAGTRRDRKRMETLIHPSFVEFGRSGTVYNRENILEEFGPNSTLPAIRSENFQMARLAEGIVLLTYVSAHLDAEGNAHRHTLRTSIWVLTEGGWQMRFHQGTPTSPDTTISST
jgi:hypothetical protein